MPNGVTIRHPDGTSADVALAIWRLLQYRLGIDQKALAMHSTEKLQQWATYIIRENHFLHGDPGLLDWFMGEIAIGREALRRELDPASAKPELPGTS